MTRSAPRRFVNDINVTALLVIGSIPCSLEILGIIGVPLREVPIRRRSVDRKPYRNRREKSAKVSLRAYHVVRFPVTGGTAAGQLRAFRERTAGWSGHRQSGLWFEPGRWREERFRLLHR